MAKRFVGWSCAALLGAATFPVSANVAPEIRVAAGQPLQQAIDRAPAGSVLRLDRGTHRGPIRIDRALTLVGAPGAEIVGNGAGSVILLDAPDIRVEGLAVRGSGTDAAAMDAGIFATARATRATISGNRIRGNFYGVNIRGARDALVRDNDIEGQRGRRTSRLGNNVSVWNAPGAKVIGNRISHGRDGIYVATSSNNEFRGNVIRNVRFAIHYMYTRDSVIADNDSIGNIVGFAIMYSDNLVVTGNRSRLDRDTGLLLNYANGSDISGNRVVGGAQPLLRWSANGERVELDGTAAPTGTSRIGPEKCAFLYNSNNNRFAGNRFAGCGIGIHFTAGSEGNRVARNAFLGNRTQVKYVGTRHLDWSDGGRGNYWSDNPAFDLDRDGIADQPYRPNDIVDRVLWQAPLAKLLVSSPALQLLRFAQSRMPAVFPGGVVDSRPLMQAPEVRG